MVELAFLELAVVVLQVFDLDFLWVSLPSVMAFSAHDHAFIISFIHVYAPSLIYVNACAHAYAPSLPYAHAYVPSLLYVPHLLYAHSYAPSLPYVNVYVHVCVHAPSLSYVHDVLSYVYASACVPRRVSRLFLIYLQQEWAHHL
jgi:hypothetical protein